MNQTTTSATSDAFVGVLQQQLEQQLGLTITAEQASCLLDNFGDTDPNDTEAVLALLITCGVDISDVSRRLSRRRRTIRTGSCCLPQDPGATSPTS